MFYTYILYSPPHKRFYIGQCSDIQARIEYHNSGYVKSTMPFIPWEMVGFIEKPSRSEAMILERKLKNFNGYDLRRFIRKYFNKTIT